MVTTSRTVTVPVAVEADPAGIPLFVRVLGHFASGGGLQDEDVKISDILAVIRCEGGDPGPFEKWASLSRVLQVSASGLLLVQKYFVNEGETVPDDELSPPLPNCQCAICTGAEA